MTRPISPKTRRGSDHPLARFTRDQVIAIRRDALCNPRSVRRIAADYGCCHLTIWRILHRIHYSDE